MLSSHHTPGQGLQSMQMVLESLWVRNTLFRLGGAGVPGPTPLCPTLTTMENTCGFGGGKANYGGHLGASQRSQSWHTAEHCHGLCGETESYPELQHLAQGLCSAIFIDPRAVCMSFAAWLSLFFEHTMHMDITQSHFPKFQKGCHEHRLSLTSIVQEL